MPDSPSYKVITLRVSDEERETLHQAAVSENTSLNALIRLKLGFSKTICGMHNPRPMSTEQRRQMATNSRD